MGRCKDDARFSATDQGDCWCGYWLLGTANMKAAYLSMCLPQAPVSFELDDSVSTGSCMLVLTNKDQFQSTAWLTLR